MYYKTVEVPSDTMAAILYIRSLFPQKMFGNVIPPIILKHQVYCVVKDRTLVDRQMVGVWYGMVWNTYMVWYDMLCMMWCAVVVWYFMVY